MQENLDAVCITTQNTIAVAECNYHLRAPRMRGRGDRYANRKNGLGDKKYYVHVLVCRNNALYSSSA
jgi:hypothetical protein